MVHDVSHSLTGPAHAGPNPQTESPGSRRPGTPRPADASTDSVELSDAARAYADKPAIRQGLVARVRAEIAKGTYITEQKIDTAAERLLRELHAGD